MNSLGAPVDSLALDYLSFSFFPVVVNNVWTWVAVITAAVSLWGIRGAVGPVAVKSETQEEKPSPQMVSVSPPPRAEEEKEAVAEPVAALASSTTTWLSTRAAMPAVDVDATTRGKFTDYYEDEGEGEAAWEGEVDDGGVVEVGGGGGGYWCDDWEKVMRMRTEGDMVWYRYQDLTVFDGNVVRLWDGSRGKSNISLN